MWHGTATACIRSLRRKCQNGEITVDHAAAMADFEKEYPQLAQRLALIADVKDWPR